MELHLGLLAVWGYYASLALLRSAVLRVPQAAAVAAAAVAVAAAAGRQWCCGCSLQGLRFGFDVLIKELESARLSLGR